MTLADAQQLPGRRIIVQLHDPAVGGDQLDFIDEALVLVFQFDIEDIAAEILLRGGDDRLHRQDPAFAQGLQRALVIVTRQGRDRRQGEDQKKGQKESHGASIVLAG